mmetsp:Transcript_24997/g.62083  ORF Transcript_24997/g.62083 Transcript_24997/m.62083 type:complete len:264 (+) Transcript_24997:417-1208(+)
MLGWHHNIPSACSRTHCELVAHRRRRGCGVHDRHLSRVVSHVLSPRRDASAAGAHAGCDRRRRVWLRDPHAGRPCRPGRVVCIVNLVADRLCARRVRRARGRLGVRGPRDRAQVHHCGGGVAHLPGRARHCSVVGLSALWRGAFRVDALGRHAAGRDAGGARSARHPRRSCCALQKSQGAPRRPKLSGVSAVSAPRGALCCGFRKTRCLANPRQLIPPNGPLLRFLFFQSVEGLRQNRETIHKEIRSGRPCVHTPAGIFSPRP